MTVSSAPYAQPLRQLINAHKERQALALTTLLGDRLALSVLRLLTEVAYEPGHPVVLVPVPSAGRAVRERGFDATAAMAGRAARRLSARHPARTRCVLEQVAGVRDQSGLDARGRQQNLAGAYRIRGRIAEGPVIVVDDLVTTGSSLAEATRCLRQAGVPVLGAATVAATVRLRPSSG